MNIESLLRDISNLYRHCQTYSDVGHSTIQFAGTGGDHINTIKSSIEFSRSGSFSLKYDVNYGGLAMLCTSIARDGNGVRVDQLDGVKVYDCLETALKIKAGVSSRITTLIPMLLLRPTDADSWLYKLTKVEEVDEHIVLSSQCDRTQAFVDSTTLMINKIRFQRAQKSRNIFDVLKRGFSGSTKNDLSVLMEHRFEPFGYSAEK